MSELGVAGWRALGISACEKRVSTRALAELANDGDSEPWSRLARDGVLVDAGMVRPFASLRAGELERAYAVAPAARPLILRRLGERGELELVRKAALGFGSDAARVGFLCALYGGELAAFERVLPELSRRAARGVDADFAPGALREALCESFDAEWLERTWGELAPRLAEQALSDALVRLEPADGPYRFANAAVSADTRPELRVVLAEHALLRGEVPRARELLSAFSARDQLGFRAALSYAMGDREGAGRALDEYERAGGSAHGATSVTALLVLLALARGGAKLGRRCLPRRSTLRAPAFESWPLASAETDVSRALRALLKQSTQPDAERTRASVHQLSGQAPPWEALIGALGVILFERDAVARAGWARRMASEAERTRAAGYPWFARQAEHVARALLPETPELAGLEPCRPGELLLADLLEPEPEWRRALGALKGFAEDAESSDDVVSLRVAWYVDMARGEPAKPALEEFQRGTGWSRGRRVDLDELDSVREALPPEDQAVLRAVEPSRARRRDLPLELLEALVGHPRVFNGARGRLPVDVSRGTCRIETRHEHGHLVIAVEPAGASEGVNVVVDGESRLSVIRVTPALGRLIALVPNGVRIPERHRAEAVGVLSRLAEHVEIRSAELGARRRVAAESTPVLRISPESGAWWVEVGVRPFGEHGRFFPPGLGRLAVTAQSGSDWLDAERDFAAERDRFRALVAACLSLGGAFAEARAGGENPDEEVFSGALGEEGLFALLLELEESSLAHALEWQDTRPLASKGTLRAAALHGALKRSKGWYLVTGGVALDDLTEVALAELATLPFTKSGRFLRLPNGDFVEVERRARRVLALLASAAEAPGRASSELRIPEAAIGTLRALIESGGRFELDEGAGEWLAHCDRTLAAEVPPVSGLQATLRSYQIEGYEWLARMSQLGLGVCLADDMGLGKTLQAIALLLARRSGGPALVVAPTSVCRNWLEELKRFAPSLRAAEYTGRERGSWLDDPPDVLIASYALLQQDAEKFTAREWNTFLLDEAQFIKNAHSLRARAAFGVPARYRFALTGTPVENHLGDLWSLFHFANPALLGAFKEFQLRFMKPIERDRDSERRGALKQLIAPFLLRREKRDVLAELPPITNVRHGVRLNDDESLRYALLRRQIRDKLHGKQRQRLHVFAEITRLRRFCCHPRLVFPDAPHESSKLAAFLELAEELRANGHRALVFSQFVDFLEIVRAELDERGFRYTYLDGSTPKEARHARVEEFQSGGGELFLISLKAGGFGLNLTAADYVIHLDPWWNPAVEAQATDRAHRIGQERPVTVYRLITEATIEERILEMHGEKRSLAEALLEGQETPVALDHAVLTELLAGE
ncbi:MAG TPA: DEAD/DEAH box helicase [Polyangiaceae bacterium]